MKKLLFGLVAATGLALSSQAGALQWTFCDKGDGFAMQEPYVYGAYMLVAWPGDAPFVADMLENWVDPITSGMAFGVIPSPLAGTSFDIDGFYGQNMDGHYFIDDPTNIQIETGKSYEITVFIVAPWDVEKADERFGGREVWMDAFELLETPWGLYLYGTFEIDAIASPDALNVEFVDFRKFSNMGWIYPIPEPATFSLLGVGVVLLGLRRRKRA